MVEIDQRWVPSRPGTSLYIRPTVIATETFLGVHPSSSYLYYVIIGPVGAYYKEGMNPVRILASDTGVRAVKGGLGAAKTAANYAASLYGAEEAQKAGYTQVLWLDGVEHRYLDEVGTMNIMLRIGDEVLTPALNGAILAGVTRDSVLTLLRDWGLRVAERPISIDEVIAAAQAGRLEMWGTGTAAVISPVGELGFKGERLRHQRRPDRCPDTATLRHHRRHPVRHRGRPAQLGHTTWKSSRRVIGKITGHRDGRRIGGTPAWQWQPVATPLLNSAI